VTSVAFAPDGFYAAWGGAGRIGKWDWSKRAQFAEEYEIDAPVSAIAFSFDGERLLYGTAVEQSQAQRASIKRISAADPWAWATTARDVRRFEGHTGVVAGVAFTSDARRVVTGSEDGSIRVWEVQSEQSLKTIPIGSPVVALDLLADDRRVVIGTNDKLVRLWDLEAESETKTYVGNEFLVRDVAVSVDGRRVASAGADRIVWVWDLETAEMLAELEGHEDRVNAVALSADGSLAVSGADDGTVRVWRVSPGESRLLQTFADHNAPVRGVAISPDGARALSGGDDRQLLLWDLSPWQANADE
jgi:WD40 repeat protein